MLSILQRLAPPLLAIVAIAAAAPALAGGVVVWLEPIVPDDKVRARTEKTTEADQHLAHSDLALTADPPADDDLKRYERLAEVLEQGRARWDEFEVELGIAREIEGVIASIDLVRSKRDRDDLVAARLFQGAAVVRAFEPETFAEGANAKPFREELPGLVANRPWLQARALDPGRTYSRGDLGDGATFPELKAFSEAVADLQPGTVDLSLLPGGVVVFVDGVEQPSGTAEVEVPAGLHYVHVEKEGTVYGRRVLEVGPGGEVAFDVDVDAEEVSRAKTKVLDGVATGFPDDVKRALDQVARDSTEPVFLAALDERGREVIVPYAKGATLKKDPLATFLMGLEVGGGVVQSPYYGYFEGKEPVDTSAPGATLGLNLELGIWHFAFLGGADAFWTPTATVPVGTGATDDTTSPVLETPVVPNLWGGFGAYVLRPLPRRINLLLAGTYGLVSPGHYGFGGRIKLGIPVGEGLWFRIVGGAHHSPSTYWSADELDAVDDPAELPLTSFWGRLGLGFSF